MYNMKEACEKTGLAYETLKFYCNQGLVPNVKRDERNRRVFDDRDIAWITGLIAMRRCGMGIQGMREYMELCLMGEISIPARKELLEARRKLLERQVKELRTAMEYIDGKQEYYDDVLAGKIPYSSNLIQE